MKSLRSPNIIIKTLIVSIILILSSFIIDGFGVCQVQKLDTSSEQQAKAEFNNGSSIKMVPYTKGTSESHTSQSGTNDSKLEETVKGLSDAGYSLEEITGILKNNNNDASSVSIACMKQGFNGQQIYKALLDAGYSKKSADSAVPLSIRQEVQVLGISTNYNEAMTQVINDNNTGKNDPMIVSDKKVVSNQQNVVEVPVSVGITFNGLGNWGAFQDKRFKAEK